MEITARKITALSAPAATPPIELWRPQLDATLPTRLDHAAVARCHPAQRAVWQVAAASMRGSRAALDAQGFTEVTTPKLVTSSTESGADVLEVDHLGCPAYLAQSPQFYEQMMVGIVERVYEVGPVFRAEPHDTVLHLAEHVSLDAELGFITDHRDVLAVLREVLMAMVETIAATGDAASMAGARPPQVPEEIPVIHFTEALSLVGADPGEPDLDPEHETTSRTALRELVVFEWRGGSSAPSPRGNPQSGLRTAFRPGCSSRTPVTPPSSCAMHEPRGRRGCG